MELTRSAEYRNSNRALQVLVSTFVSPILGGLTIAVLAAVALRLRPEGFARA